MMRCVVRASQTDIPLCVRCWTKALEREQRRTVRIMDDVVSFSALPESLDDTSVVLCYCPQTGKSCTTDKTPLIPFPKLYTTSHDNTLLCEDAKDASVVQQQESRNRLEMEVWEAEARARLIEAACDAIHRALALLATQREAIHAEWETAAAVNNAQQVVSFFDEEDMVARAATRRLNAERSYAWLLRTHAMRLAFPIDTSGPVAMIAGLRLGYSVCPSSSRRRSPAVQPRSAGSTPPRPSVYASELNGSGEATALLNFLHVQQEYTRTLLGSHNDTVSVAEINHACGFLLLLLQHMIDRHHIDVQGSVLRPNGEESRVEAITVRGTLSRATHRLADFFICENFFRWKSFGAACVTVASCVREISEWMEEHLGKLRGAVQSRMGFSASVVLRSLGPTTPPHQIAQDQVDGFPVRHGDVSNEVWTLGMKKLLEVVQWCTLASRDVDSLQHLLEEL